MGRAFEAHRWLLDMAQRLTTTPLTKKHNRLDVIEEGHAPHAVDKPIGEQPA